MWINVVVSLALLYVIFYPSTVFSEDWVPTVEIVNAAIRDVEQMTGWLTTGIPRPTVRLVGPDVLKASRARNIRWGQYDKTTNEIVLSEACRTTVPVLYKCDAVLRHELIHWVQLAHTSWPGTPLEWELEAQFYETRWVASKMGVLGSPARWRSAGEKPSPQFLLNGVVASLPSEVQAVWSSQAVMALILSPDLQTLSLGDGCFQDTRGAYVCVWVLKLLTQVGEARYGIVITLREQHLLSVDLRRFTSDETPEVVGWWWDKGFRPDAQGRIPVNAVWTGKWERTR